MMREKKKHGRLFGLTLFFMCLFAANFSLFPTAVLRQLDGKSALLVFCGAVFWLSAGLSVGFLIWTDRLRRKIEKPLSATQVNRAPGMFCFFRNPEAAAIDAILILCTALFFLLKLFQKPSVVLFPAVAALVLLFFLHAMLNGRNYRFLRDRKRTDRS